MKVVIIGQKWLAAELLLQCRAAGHEVAGVICPAGDRTAKLASTLGVPVKEVGGRVEEEHVPDSDLVLAAHAFSYVTQAAREKARHGVLAYHPSLLPRHRGRDAIRWALHMRDLVTGGTLYWMDDGADTGPIAIQDWCWVLPDDTPKSLWQRELAPMGLRLFAKALDVLSAGGRLPAAQQCQEVATWEPGFSKVGLSSVHNSVPSGATNR